jgi:hypothetical protein
VQSRTNSAPKPVSLPKAIGFVLFGVLQALTVGPLIILAIMSLLGPGIDSGLLFVAFWPIVALALLLLCVDGALLLVIARKKEGTTKLVYIATGIVLFVPAIWYALLNLNHS